MLHSCGSPGNCSKTDKELILLLSKNENDANMAIKKACRKKTCKLIGLISGNDKAVV